MRLFRRQWLEELIVWADRRRYFLSTAEKKYVLTEICTSLQIADIDVRSNNLRYLDGYRTQIALLLHDVKYDSVTVFKATGDVPSSPSVLLDSRLQFLIKRTNSVLQPSRTGPLHASPSTSGIPFSYAHDLVVDMLLSRPDVEHEDAMLRTVPYSLSETLRSGYIPDVLTQRRLGEPSEDETRLVLMTILHGLQYGVEHTQH